METQDVAHEVPPAPARPRCLGATDVEFTFLRRYRLRHDAAEHSSFLFFGSKKLSKQPFHSRHVENTEYKTHSILGLPVISLSTIAKVIAAAIALAIMLFGLIKALIKAIKMLIKTLKAIVKIAKSLKMPDLSGEFLPDIPGLPKMPSLALPAGLSLPSPPKLSLGKMFSMVGFGLGGLLAPLLILAALALLSKYRIFKARLWPPLSGLPGLRNPLFRLPYKDFKSVFGHLPYFNQLQTAGKGIPIFGLPKGTKNPGKQPQSPSIPPPKIEGLGARDYDAVMKGYDYSHGVKLGKNLMLHSLILRMSMIFKLGKEKIPFMGPPTVKEMFGTEGFMQKIIRLLAKGAVAAGAASVVFLETEAVCPWPRHAICPWPKARELPFALSEHGDLQTGTLLAAPSTAVGGRRHLRSGEAMLPLVVESPRGRRQELLYNFL